MDLEKFNYECEGQIDLSEYLKPKLTHLSLFTGIGGLDLAAEWAGFETVGQCEYAEYPTKVLEKHWPNVERWKDIHELSADKFIRRTGIKRGELTCISGGFPCQPHSVAGMRKASGDERDLWPEYRRVISEIRPKWVVAENVRGLISSEFGGFFRGILRDFSNLGYDVGWCCYRAADVGAVHPRERIAIIAHARSERLRTSNDNWEKRHIQEDEFGNVTESEPKRNRWKSGVNEDIKTTSYADSKYGQRIFTDDCKKNNTGNKAPGKRSTDWFMSQFRAGFFTCIYGGDEEYCKPLICRNDDGFSEGMDRDKCLGNAVMPQQFYPVFKAIADIELAN